MILEIAQIAIREGEMDAFLAVMADEGLPGLLTSPGCHSARVLPGIENPNIAAFIVEWESTEAHDAARASEGFTRFRNAGGPFFGQGGSMMHFQLP